MPLLLLSSRPWTPVVTLASGSIRAYWPLLNRYFNPRRFKLPVIGLSFFLLLVSPCAVLAQETPSSNTPSPVQISLSDALELAEDYNPDLLAARKRHDISLADVGIARQEPNPEISGTYTFGNIARQLGQSQLIGITQLIETAGKHPKRVEVAQAELELTDKEINTLRWEIRARVRQAYAQLAASKENLRVLHTQSELLDRLVDIAAIRVRAGAAPESELLLAKLTRSQLETQMNEAKGRLRQDRRTLFTLLGEQVDPNFDISDNGLFYGNAQQTELVPLLTTTIPSQAELELQAREVRPDLKALVQRTVVSQKELRALRAEKVPDIELTGGFTFVNAITPDGPFEKGFFSGGYLASALVLPIRHNQGAQIQRAKAMLSKTALEIEATEKQIRLDIDNAYTACMTARENIQLYQSKLLPESKDVLSLAQKSYAAGKSGLVSVILAQQTVQKIFYDYLESIVAYQNAWGDLEKAAGGKVTLP